MERGLLSDIVSVLEPIFGEPTAKMIEKNFEDENPQALINVAHKMLSDFMGEENAIRILGTIVKKFSKLKIYLEPEVPW